jgi:hypothetical protein
MKTDAITTITIERSRRGIPCLWEQGGGLSNTGTSRIISDCDGNAKTALYVRTHGDLACGNHALIPIKAGDKIVTVDRHRSNVDIQVYEIVGIKGDSATIQPYCGTISPKVVEAAVDKSYDYHCREAYYIKQSNHATTPSADLTPDEDFLVNPFEED